MLFSFSARAIEDAGLFDLSLDQLSKIEIKSDITSIKAKPIREQPGIVSVVSGQQISESGARDLSDVLMQVPGFAMDSDVESMVGLTFRGLQGQEGKVLLIVDGIEMNESLYGSLPILNHIPADMIQQVEIIRGPGSAMYGGSAALAVIRVTTKGPDHNGGYVVETPAGTDGRFDNTITTGFGYKTNDWRISLNAAYSDNSLSSQTYTSLSGTNLDLTHKSAMGPIFLDADAGWRDFDVRVIYDAYRYDDSVYYGDPPASPSATRFDSISTIAKYEGQPATWLKLAPSFTFRHQIPWYNESDELGNYDVTVDHYQADLVGVADVTDNSGLMVGARYFHDVANALDNGYGDPPAALYYNGHSSVAYDDLAGFAQYDLDTRWVNVSVGGRYEYHDALGGHFVPRVALTKAWKKFHLKALYSQASRIPGINVINSAVGGPIEDEQTANYELEAGYRFTDSLSWIGNVFYIEVNKPIIYSAGDVSSFGSDGYYNGSKISSSGLETELRWDRPKFSAALNYSYYRAIDNDIDYVRGDAEDFLAAPTHKVGVTGTWHITKALDWNLNGFWIGDRLAYAYPAAGVTALPQEFILNSFVNYKFKRFSFGIGVANLLDQDRFAPQPYNGGAGPYPLKGREFFAKLAFKF